MVSKKEKYECVKDENGIWTVKPIDKTVEANKGDLQKEGVFSKLQDKIQEKKNDYECVKVNDVWTVKPINKSNENNKNNKNNDNTWRVSVMPTVAASFGMDDNLDDDQKK